MKTVIYDYQIFSHQKFGGVSRYFCEMASRIQEQQRGWRSTVVAPLHFNEYLAGSDVPTWGVYLPLPFARLGKIYDSFNKLAAALPLVCSGASVLHQTYYSVTPSITSARRVVTVFDMIHELFPQYFSPYDPVPQMKKRAVERADHVICISYRTAEDLVRILGVPREKITVTHLASSKVFAGSEIRGNLSQPNEDRPYFLYVGQRAGYKNFSRVLEALAAAPKVTAEFDFIAFGGPPFTQDELARIKKLHLRSTAVRQEFGNDADLARCYAGARAFIYPSEYEGFGIPPLEAMGSGCAVICSNTSSIPEVAGQAAEYFDPTEVDSIRAAIEFIAFDDARRAELIAAGTTQSRLFSWGKCAAETLTAYERC